MIGYRDRAWCTAYPDRCANAECGRAVTAEVIEAANRWWKDSGGDGCPPFALAEFFSTCESVVPVEEGESDA